MSTLELKGASIHYNKIGKGPIIIFIPGANGTGDIFMPLAEQLKDHFTVVTVDRRGFGQSPLTEELPVSASEPHDLYRVKQDAKDIADIAKHLSDQPVYILGSSSGSIVAMHVLKEHPEVVKAIAFHEPPINTFLPDAAYWQEKNNEIVKIALTEGMPQAMALFGKTLHIAPIDAQSMSKPAVSEDAAASKKRFQEMQNWFKYEIRQYTTSNIELELFEDNQSKITLLNGTDSRGSFPQDVNFYIHEQTGVPIVDIAGGHLGYVQKPEQFAEGVKTLWRNKQ